MTNTPDSITPLRWYVLSLVHSIADLTPSCIPKLFRDHLFYPLRNKGTRTL